MKRRTAWALLMIVTVLTYCMLSFYQTGNAGSPIGSPPFANALEVQLETLEQLKEIKELLKAQNALLRSGEARVMVTLPSRSGDVAQPSQSP